MIQTGGAKPLSQLVRESGVLAEHDALDDRGPRTAETTGDRVPQAPPHGVCETAETASSTDFPPAVDPEHDVHSMTP